MRTILALTVLASASMTADAADIKSGLQVGDYPGAYYVADITGPSAGEKLCYRCKYGARPVVNIFARKMDENVTKLVKELDAVVGKNRDSKMAAFVVVLSDDPDAQEAQLKAAATKHGIKNTPLTVFDNSAGPKRYKIAKEADITVMMWVDSEVKVNHAMKATELNGSAITKIVGDTKQILN
ncbi:MAG: hypothetical protein NXI04_29700 [Planctomycetaceae bacterium]|nr:hypothetical protein [Planctomycetaceae bacterium]